jgi:hypothetical protein
MLEGGMVVAQDIAHLMGQIIHGDVTLTALWVDPGHHSHGNVYYRCSNGWWLAVYNDADDWDYLAEVVSPSGDRLDFEALDAMGMTFSELEDLSPEAAQAMFGIPETPGRPFPVDRAPTNTPWPDNEVAFQRS